MPAPKGEGKKAKVSKKEQLLLEQQRLVEEAQKAEEAELQRQANEEKRAREEEQQKALKLQQEKEEETLRLLEQARRDHRYLNRQQQQLSHLHTTVDQQHEWQRYLECNPLPDVRHEAELNTYLSLWREAAAASAQPHTLLQPVINSCSVSESIVSSLHDAASLAREEHDVGTQQLLNNYQHTLRHLITAKVDQLTSAYLTHSDQYEDDQKTFTVSHHSPHIDYALWVHTSAKHGRVKRIEWPDIGMTVELPVALQQSRIAIRVVRTTFDHVSEKEEAEDDVQPAVQEASGEEAAARSEERERERQVRRALRPPHHFVSVGGMICIEQLALPPPPKQAKGWAMRELAHTCSALQVIPYPTEDNTQATAAAGAGGAAAPAAAAATAAASAAQSNAPLRLSFHIPASAYLPQQTPHFGWYDVNAHAWRQDGITLLSFDPSSRLTQLALSSLHPFALIQPRALDFPYRQWYLHSHDGSTELLLKGSRYDAVVEVKGADKPENGGVCRLVSPAHPLLSAINDQWHPPGRLLLLARELGINLAPTTDDGDYCRKPRKREELVEAVHGHLAAVVGVFDIGGMEMNGGRGERTLMLKVRVGKGGVELAGSVDKKRRWEERREADDWYRQEKEEEAARLREEKSHDAAQEEKQQPDGADSEEDELDAPTSEQKQKEAEEQKHKDELVAADKAKQDKEKQPAATQQTQPTAADSSAPVETVEQRSERSQQWHTVLVTLTDIDGSAIDAQEEQSAVLPYGTIAEHVPGGHHLLRFLLVKGATNGQVDLAPLPGCLPHSSLRRCLYAYFKGLVSGEEADLAAALDMAEEESSGALSFWPVDEGRLHAQQTVRKLLNMCNVFRLF